MANAVLKIAGRDYSSFLKLYDDQYDSIADSSHVDPQWAGSPALRQGQTFISDAVTNKHWQVPVMLTAASVDAVNALVAQIGTELKCGATVEYAPEGASQSSFYTLQRGILRPTYSHPVYRHFRVVALLELWTEPFASTGTTRLIASQAGTGPLSLPATGVIGDRPADVQLDYTVGSQMASTARLLAYCVSPATSGQIIVSPSQMTQSPSTTLVTGASGAIASVYMPVVMNASQVGFVTFSLDRAAHLGRNRMLAIVRSRVWPPTAMALQVTQNDLASNATTALSYNATGWQVVDLGEQTISVASNAASSANFLALYAMAASGASLVASPACHINAIIALPLEQGGAGLAVMTERDFPRPGGTVGRNQEMQPSQPFVLRGAAIGGTGAGMWLGTASQLQVDLTARFRGDVPRLPPTGSPVASQQNVFAMAGDIANFVGNDGLTVGVSVREKFSFYR